MAGEVRLGDPFEIGVTMGPVVSAAQFERVKVYIRNGIEEGAELVAGGLGRPEGIERGYFARPTVFARVRNDMTIAREEIFGPVLCILPYEDEEDAVRIANDSDYGLAAYVSGPIENGDAERQLRGLIHRSSQEIQTSPSARDCGRVWTPGTSRTLARRGASPQAARGCAAATATTSSIWKIRFE